MNAKVERLVRQITRARRLGDTAGLAIAWSRLAALARQPGYSRAFDRALRVVDWS